MTGVPDKRLSPSSSKSPRPNGRARVLPLILATACVSVLLCTGLIVDYRQTWTVTVQSNLGTRLPKATLTLMHGVDPDKRRVLTDTLTDGNGRARIELHEQYLDEIDTTEYFITASSSDTTPAGQNFLPGQIPVLFGVDNLTITLDPDTSTGHH